MGDQEFPGVYLTQIESGLTDRFIGNRIRTVLWQGNVEQFISKTDYKVTLIDGGEKSCNAVVTGIHLPYRVIREKLKARMLGNHRLFNIADVDFGLPRDKTGLIEPYFNKRLHDHLKEGQGFLEDCIKPFSPWFVDHVLGPNFDVEYTLVIKEPKHKLKLDMLTGRPGFLDHRNHYKSYLEVDGTILQFLTRFDTLQAILYLNGNAEFCDTGTLFEPTRPIDRNHNEGLGVDGKVLDVKALMKSHGYIPLTYVDGRMIDLVLIKSTWESRCIFCSKLYNILGFDPDFNWLAADCNCDAETACYSWPNEKFFRVTLGVVYARRYEQFVKNYTDEPLILLIKGVMPLSGSTDEFRRSCYGAEKIDFQIEKRLLATKFQEGTIFSDIIQLETKYSEEGKGEGRVTGKRLVNMELRTPTTELWEPEGTKTIKKVRIIAKSDVTTHNPTIDDLEMLNTKSHKGVLQKITAMNDGYSIVELIIWVDMDFNTNIGEGMIMVPLPHTAGIDSIANALRHWRGCLNSKNKFTPIQRASVERVKQLKLEDTHVPDFRKNAWRVQIRVEVNHVIQEILTNETTSVYYGMDVYANSSSQYGNKYASADESRIMLGRMVSAVLNPDNQNEATIIAYILPGALLCSFKPKDIIQFRMWMGYYQHEEITNSMAIDMFVLHNSKPPSINPSLPQHCKDVNVIRNMVRCPFSSKPDMRNYLLKPSSSSSKPQAKLSMPKVNIMHENVSRRCNRAYRRYLNPSQSAAIDSMLMNRVVITEGPPGCGKTLTGVHGVIAHHSTMTGNGLILVVTPTNLAANVFFDKLCEVMTSTSYRLRAIRMFASNREEDVNAELSDNYLHTAVRKENSFLSDQVVVDLIAKKEGEERVELTENEEKLIKRHISHVCNDVLRKTDVIVCTVGAAVDGRLQCFLSENEDFCVSAIVMDESNCVTIGATLPLLGFYPNKMWMLGDVHQLTPCLSTKIALTACGDVCWMRMLNVTQNIHNLPPMTYLNEQYRFYPDVCKLVSDWCYEGRVTSSSTVLERPIQPFIDGPFHDEFPEFGTSHIMRISYDSEVNQETKGKEYSYYNEKECNIMLELVEGLLRSDILQDKITILSMYKEQVQQVSKRIVSLYPNVHNFTVDSFEGKESSIVIISMVRCNSRNKIGFLRESNRTNVALSRVVNYLFFISSEDTFKKSSIPDMKKLYEIMDNMNIPVISK